MKGLSYCCHVPGIFLFNVSLSKDISTPSVRLMVSTLQRGNQCSSTQRSFNSSHSNNSNLPQYLLLLGVEGVGGAEELEGWGEPEVGHREECLTQQAQRRRHRSPELDQIERRQEACRERGCLQFGRLYRCMPQKYAKILSFTENKTRPRTIRQVLLFKFNFVNIFCDKVYFEIFSMALKTTWWQCLRQNLKAVLQLSIWTEFLCNCVGKAVFFAFHWMDLVNCIW